MRRTYRVLSPAAALLPGLDGRRGGRRLPRPGAAPLPRRPGPARLGQRHRRGRAAGSPSPTDRAAWCSPRPAIGRTRLGGLVLAGAAMGAGRRAATSCWWPAAAPACTCSTSATRPGRGASTTGRPRATRARCGLSGDLVALADGDDGVHLFRLEGERLRHLSSIRPSGGATARLRPGLLRLAAARRRRPGRAAGRRRRASRSGRACVGRLAMRDAARGVSVRGSSRRRRRRHRRRGAGRSVATRPRRARPAATSPSAPSTGSCSRESSPTWPTTTTAC